LRFEFSAGLYNIQYPTGVSSLSQHLQMAREEAAERDVIALVEKLKNEEPEKDHNE
jgi:hypothetical protein